MKHIIILIIAALFSVAAWGQESADYASLNERQIAVETQQQELTKQLADLQNVYNAQLRQLRNENAELRAEVARLSGRTSMVSDSVVAMNQTVAAQNLRLSAADSTLTETRSQLSETGQAVGRNLRYAIALALALIVALVAVVIVFVRRYRANRTSLNAIDREQQAIQQAQNKLREAQTALAEEQVKIDNKLIDLFEGQIKQQSVEPKAESDKPAEVDHSLALRVADEIIRIEANLARMDSSIKGYKQLQKAVERILDNFKAKGYEIENMLGQKYTDGMKLTANFVNDDDLPEGTQVITKVIKPQIRYNGKLIQAAEVTVSQNI